MNFVEKLQDATKMSLLDSQNILTVLTLLMVELKKNL